MPNSSTKDRPFTIGGGRTLQNLLELGQNFSDVASGDLVVGNVQDGSRPGPQPCLASSHQSHLGPSKVEMIDVFVTQEPHRLRA